MKLAFIIRDLGHGGAQRQLSILTAGLVREGHEVSVLHFYGGAFESSLREAGVKTLCIGKKSRWDLLGFFFRLIKAARSVQPEVLHGYLAESNLMALFLKPFCGFPRIVWGVRDSQTDAHLWGTLGKLSFRLNCLLARFADVIICNSKAGRDYYLARGYPAQKTHVVPNGIDTQRFQPTGKSAQCSVPSAQTTELSTSSANTRNSECTTFGLVGRLSPMKDHATFLKAAALVPNARFVIVGSGDEAYAQQMRELATSLGVNVTWLPAQSDMPSVYATFDCLVNSSAFGEGFSNVIGEAMACGVPCIASDVGDSAWIIGNKSQIFPAGDHEALAKCMRAFCPSPQPSPRKENLHSAVSSAGEREPECAAPISESLSPRESFQMQRNLPCGERLGEGPVETLSPRSRIVSEFSIDRLIERTSRLLGKKVLWITTGLGSGGAEMMLAQLVNGLPKLQHVVVSLTAGGKHAASLPNVHSLDMPAGKPTLSALWKLFRLIRREKPDVLMGWMYHGCLVATLAKFMRFKQVPMIWNIRQSLYDLKLEKRGSAMVIRALAWLSWLPKRITYNSQLSSQQHEAIGYAKTKTQLIANGFDLAKWKPDVKRVFQLVPNELENSFYIGRFGRNAPMKDYPTFIEAAKLIHAKHPETRFIIVGAETESLDVPPFIEVLGERHDLPELTASLNIAVSSSAFGEGFPNVVGEAMACAVPVVATDIGDTRWVMGETGRLVPPRDPQVLAKACLEILDSGLTQDRAARERIERHFSLTSVLGQFESLITSEGTQKTEGTEATLLTSHISPLTSH
jgi:glycosyltransferase involved in cell wall biosynthesis